MTAVRKFTVHGTATTETEIVVTVDNDICYRGPASSGEIFSFNTPVDLHGKVLININVASGQLILNNTTVTYPAVINNVNGYVSFEQPIQHPRLGLDLDELNNITLAAGEAISYYHITFNGPNYWQVSLDQDVDPGTVVNIGDIRTAEVSSFMRPVFDYTPYPCSAKDPKDLVDLKSRILTELI
jgi:hypothetical protein